MTWKFFKRQKKQSPKHFSRKYEIYASATAMHEGERVFLRATYVSATIVLTSELISHLEAQLKESFNIKTNVVLLSILGFRKMGFFERLKNHFS